MRHFRALLPGAVPEVSSTTSLSITLSGPSKGSGGGGGAPANVTACSGPAGIGGGICGRLEGSLAAPPKIGGFEGGGW